MHTLLRYLALRHGRFARVWQVLGKPTADEWAEYQRRWGGFHHLGQGTVLAGTRVTEPEWVSIGDNVILSFCNLITHDASATVMDVALDRPHQGIGRIVIHDNVFIGANAVVLPNVEIGPNAIVAAGAVVNHDVPEGMVVAGVPAKVVGNFFELADRRHREFTELPWSHLAGRPPTDPELSRLRLDYLWNRSS
jgi:acetyltransferase-like isoleucine patch superfamily enzyme